MKINGNWGSVLREERLGMNAYIEPADLRQRFDDMLKVFVWEKHFIGAGGMELTDEVKVVIETLVEGVYDRFKGLVAENRCGQCHDSDGG